MYATNRMKWIAAALAGLSLATQVRTSSACGCFAPPSPMTPVVQAGERILFAHDGNQVTAYIQIQYQGNAADFGWLVPLPSVPTLELGTDELFTTLQRTTNPQYQISTQRDYCGGPSNYSVGGCGGFGDSASVNYSTADAGASFASDLGAFNPALVEQGSIGPYDYAVLKADDKTEMLTWLADNRYYVPDATGQAVQPYIHTGAFFLALKLKSGENAGSVAPIVLRYASDLPMIPITLTQVGAIPDMGVLVWLLGNARAIPRNYYHVELNEMPIWENLLDYPKQAIRAIHDAPQRHAFLTEYAGASSVMDTQLDYAGRFGDLDLLRTITKPAYYLQYLRNNGFAFDATLFGILARYLPMPQELVAQGVTATAFYQNYDYYIGQAGPQADPDAGTALAFDAMKLTDDLNTRIVQPSRAASKLFDRYPYLTRMYTALSPEDMNLDPVFSENPDLPSVNNVHTATLRVPCKSAAWLRTETGREEQWLSSLPPNKVWPATVQVQRLREAGAPEVVTDNGALITQTLGTVDHGSAGNEPESTVAEDHGGCGACDVRRGGSGGALGSFALVGVAILLVRRRRRVS